MNTLKECLNPQQSQLQGQSLIINIGEAKGSFKSQHLAALNATMDDYIFDVRSGAKYSLESDLTLAKDDVPLEQRGKGQQCFC